MNFPPGGIFIKLDLDMFDDDLGDDVETGVSSPRGVLTPSYRA